VTASRPLTSRPAATAVFWARVAAGIGVTGYVLWAVPGAGLHPSWAWLGPALFMVAKLAADLFPVKLNDLEFTVSGVVLVAAVIVFPEPAPVLIAVIPSIIADLRQHKSWDRVTVNAASEATTVFVAQYTYSALRLNPVGLSNWQDIGALAAVVGVYYFLSISPPALMVALNSGRSVIHVMRANMHSAYLDLIGIVLFGILTAFVWTREPRLLVILVGLGVVVYKVFELAGRLDAETVLALQTIVDIVDERDRYTYNHSLLVAEYSRLVAQRLVSDPQKVETIVRASYLHDIGKIGVSDIELNKPGKLSPEEYEKMKRHPEMGSRILAHYSQFKEGADIVLAHQEHYDGTGYPRRLRGDEIPLGARIIAVVDAYVAMTTDRPYRQAMTPAAAADQLRQGIGTHFDPIVGATFLKLLIENHLGERDQVVEMERLREARRITA